MPAEILCPHCQAEIPSGDVNVRTDVALCRACGQTSSFSAASGDGGASLNLLASPPKSIRRDTDEWGNERIVYRREIPGGKFILPLVLLAEVIFLFLVCSQIFRGEPGIVWLVALPFVVAGVASACVAIFVFRGRSEVTLERGSGRLFTGVGRFGRTRRFTLDRNSAIALESTTVKVNNVPQSGICIRNGEQKFIFGATIPAESKAYIAAALLDAKCRM